MMRIFVLLLGLAFSIWAGSTLAATMTVTTLSDTVADDGECSLREAILNAENADQSGSVDCPVGDEFGNSIDFSAALTGQTLVLSGQALPTITREIEIYGPDSGNPAGLTIDANQQSRHFHFQQSGDIILSDLTLTGGRASEDEQGGSILIEEGAAVTLDRLHLVNNATQGPSGDGGSVAVLNAAVGISHSVLANNQATGNGGAVYAEQSALQLDNTVVEGNVTTLASSGGGGIWLLDGSLVMSDSSINDNATQGGSFGASGGGVYADGSSVNLSGVSVTGNTTNGTGGGLWFRDATLDISATTISSNHAGGTSGGLRLGQSVGRLTNSTISGNTNAMGAGAALYLRSSIIEFLHVTVAFNEGQTSDNHIFVFVSPDGPARLTLINSLLLVESCRGVGSGSLFVNIGSMATDASCRTWTLPPELLELGPLDDHGGPTLTHALPAGSVATGAAGDCGADWGLTVDQRGQPRPGPNGTPCDVGAYESDLARPEADLAITVSAVEEAIQLDQVGDFLVEISQNGPDPALDLRVAIELPAGLSFTSATASLGDYDHGSGEWVIEWLSAGDSALLDFKTTAEAVGTQVLEASVSAYTADPVSANNSASASIEVWPLSEPLMVTTLADEVADDGECSLREAILHIVSSARSGSGDCTSDNLFGDLDAVGFDPSLSHGVIELAGMPLPTLTTDIRIEGPIPGDASGITIEAGGLSRIFQATGNINATINALTLTGGWADGAAQSGGAIRIEDGVHLRMNDVRLIDNQVVDGSNHGGALAMLGSRADLFNCEFSDNLSGHGDGGAIFVEDGRLLLVRCLLTNNQATSGRGGAVYSFSESGRTYLENTTVSGNQSGQEGGGLHNTGSLQLAFSTVVNNWADSGAMDVVVQRAEPGSGERFELWHSLVVQDVPGTTSCSLVNVVPSAESSLSTDAVCTGSATSADQIALGPLTDNGGPTRTHALAPDSVAIDMGDPDCSFWLGSDGLFEDQRLQQRPGVGSTTCDAGAYERQVLPVDQIFKDRFASPSVLR